jgi:predicted Zn finger-like uncharacterized protein
VHVACPQCGTGYNLKPDMLERERLRLRCRHCRHVWDPRRPLQEVRAPAATPSTETAAVDADEDDLAEAVARALDEGVDTAPERREGEAAIAAVADHPAPRPPRHRLAAMLYALAAVLTVASLGGIGWAYRDALPFASVPLPALTNVQPAWRGDGDGRRLVVSAEIANPGAEPTEIRQVRVKFLSAQGAWIDETVVDVPAVTVPAGASSTFEMAVDRLPEGTASLELSVVPADPLS